MLEWKESNLSSRFKKKKNPKEREEHEAGRDWIYILIAEEL